MEFWGGTIVRWIIECYATNKNYEFPFAPIDQ